MKKNLIAFHLYPGDKNYIENLQHFLSFGYSPNDDYYILVAGDCDLNLPTAPNIKYLKTENKNNDYGGYCELFDHISNIDEYEYIFFINSSVRGPFLAPGSTKKWTDLFIEHFDDNTGIVGSTICILHDESHHAKNYKKRWGGTSTSHVQTTAYALRPSTVIELLNYGFYSNNAVGLPKDDVIENYEIRLSQLILGMGLNLKCLQPAYNSINYLLPHEDINPTSALGAPFEANGFFGRTIHPFEGVFVKSNRNIYSNHYLYSLAYSCLLYQKKDSNLYGQEFINDYHIKIKHDLEKARYSKTNDIGSLVKIIAKQNTDITALEKHLSDKDKIINYFEDLEMRFLNSRSYKITKPLRLITKMLSKK